MWRLYAPLAGLVLQIQGDLKVWRVEVWRLYAPLAGLVLQLQGNLRAEVWRVMCVGWKTEGRSHHRRPCRKLPGAVIVLGPVKRQQAAHLCGLSALQYSHTVLLALRHPSAKPDLQEK